MKLKINNAIEIPTLKSVYQSYSRENNFIVRTTATFEDADSVVPIIDQLKDAESNTLEVLTDDGRHITDFTTGKLSSVDRNVMEEVAVIFYFD